MPTRRKGQQKKGQRQKKRQQKPKQRRRSVAHASEMSNRCDTLIAHKLGDILTGGRQRGAERAPNTARTDNRYFHYNCFSTPNDVKNAIVLRQTFAFNTALVKGAGEETRKTTPNRSVFDI